MKQFGGVTNYTNMNNKPRTKYVNTGAIKENPGEVKSIQQLRRWISGVEQKSFKQYNK